MTERFVRRTLDDEEIWVDLEAGQFYTLNHTAARILELVRDGASSTTDIVALLTAEYHVPPHEAAAAVRAVLHEARSHGMVGA